VFAAKSEAAIRTVPAGSSCNSSNAASAPAFAQAGAAVVVADLNGDGARAATDELVAAGYKAIGIRCNVAEAGEVEAMARETVATFGRLGVAFNNAGIQTVLV
jgi:NAD(P)-dependent dehydrogenase (short-subunit alcohol dehydrogenase family)